MGQFMPSSLIPSTLTETYSVDATQALQFSCQINGTSPTTQYRLQIMQNNSSSTLVYDTNVVTLSTPLYPVDYNGNPNELVVTIPANTMQNNNNYKWTITSYWSGGSIQSYENVFYTYATPTLTINSVPATLAQNSYTFTATYSQAQNVGVEKFGWILTNVNTQEVLVDTITQNNIYSSDIQLYYDGFFTNNTYEIMCQCWASNGVVVSTDYTQFTVSYDVESMAGVVIATQQNDSGIFLEWPELSSIVGTYVAGSGAASSPSYYYNSTVQSQVIHLTYGTSIADKSYVQFNQVNSSAMALPIFSSHVISFNWNDYNAIGSPLYTFYLNSSSNTYIQIYLNANRNFSILYQNNGTQVYNQEFYQPTRSEQWYVISLVPNQQTGNFIIYTYAYGYTDLGLLPSTTLYPSATLYPSGPNTLGTVANEQYSANLGVDISSTITQVEAYSPTDINYILIKEGQITEQQIEQYNVITYEPEWDFDTELLATFDGDLNAGNIKATGQLIKWMVYRNSSISSQLIHIFDTEPLVSSLIDYGACNQTTYTYYVYPVYDTGIGAPIQSNAILTNWWSWVLLSCSNMDIANTYSMTKSYVFDLDVTSGTMSNNTAFNVLENFTPYAKIQNSNSNYWSGTLTSLLGNMPCDGGYVDTVQQMNEIKALSSDTSTKILKDRKGNIWMVRISAPINEQISDQYIEQAVSITFTWMEIGSMDGVSVVLEAPST